MRLLLVVFICLACASSVPVRADVAVGDDQGIYKASGTDPDQILVGQRVFAKGFHRIQGMAWHGGDLWISNAPDLTVVRDLDGDGEADDYIVVGRHLGDRKHGLHGIAWGADGKLYLATGDLSAMPERELGRPVTFHNGEYASFPALEKPEHTREGAVLRCDADGRSLEVVKRGLSNPQNVDFDDAFQLHLDVPDVAALRGRSTPGSEEKRQQPRGRWTFAELMDDLGSMNSACSVAAQEELCRRGESVKVGLIDRLEHEGLSKRQRTWALWTLGRAGKDDVEIEAWFAAQPVQSADANTRVQSLRIIGFRMREFGFTKQVPASVAMALNDLEPMVRREAVAVLWHNHQVQHAAALAAMAVMEKDAAAFELACQALGELADDSLLKRLREDGRPGARAAFDTIEKLRRSR